MDEQKELLNKINEIATSFFFKSKEKVDDSRAIIAEYIIAHIPLDNLDNIILFCVANNLLNSYVKQEGALFGYAFKASIYRLLEEIKSKDIDKLSMDYQKDKGVTLLIVMIDREAQFSFHAVPKTIKDEIPKIYKSSITWDKLRKQNCAVTIFDLLIRYMKSHNLAVDTIKTAEELNQAYIDQKIDFKVVKKQTYLPEYCFKK